MLFEYKKIKNILDRFFAIFCLLFLSPVLIFITLLLILTQDKNFLFSQTRVGYKEKRFKIFKFKTMIDKKNNQGRLLQDHQRITFIGKFLRNISFDELPSLFNIAKGEMSFVGPRPLLEEYLEFYTFEELKRHNVKPGLTGWAQINGRNKISWEQKFNFDIWYVKNQNFILDFTILIITFWKVLKRNGINNSKEITMPYFKRNKK